MMKKYSTLCLIALAVAGCSDPEMPDRATLDYVPDEGWSGAPSPDFYERWFGDQLYAMREPPLASARDLSGYRERFRLTVLPSFSPGSAYRIDTMVNGDAYLRWARLDGFGGYDTGKLSFQSRRKLTTDEVARFRSAIMKSQFHQVGREVDEVTPTYDEKGVLLGHRFCLDGTEKVFEEISDNKQYYAIRNCGFNRDRLKLLFDVVTDFVPRSPYE